MAEEPCCTRDTDGDGNCPVHLRKGVLRDGTYVSAEAVIEDIEEMKKEWPDVNPEDVAHDLAIAMFQQMDSRTRHAIARGFLGWDPVNDRDLYINNRVPLREGR